MANTQYVTPNRLTLEVNRVRKWIFFCGLPVIAFVAYQQLIFIWFAVFFWLVAILGAAPVRRAGAKGENRTLAMLRKLPDSYTIFNQVEVPNANSRTGFTELDFVILGPNGIFVVEVKNNNSKVVGSESDGKWVTHKVGRRGTPYKSSVRNPVKQLKGQVHVLSQHLKANRCATWVNGLVFFSNRRSKVVIKGTCSVPVLTRKGLVEHISTHIPERTPRQLDNALRHLKALKQ